MSDHGGGSLPQPQVGERDSRAFSGVGAGIRGTVGRAASMRVDVGYPLTDQNQLNKDKILFAQMVSR